MMVSKKKLYIPGCHSQVNHVSLGEGKVFWQKKRLLPFFSITFSDSLCDTRSHMYVQVILEAKKSPGLVAKGAVQPALQLASRPPKIGPRAAEGGSKSPNDGSSKLQFWVLAA